MSNIHYIYKYSHNNIPIYIGMGKKDRYKVHLRSRTLPKYSKVYFYKKLNKLLRNNEIVDIEILHTELSREEAIQIEKYYIAFYGRRVLKTGVLYNLTSGGDGGCSGVVTEETREKIRQNWLGRKHTEESIKKMSLVQKGLKHRGLNDKQKEARSVLIKERWSNKEFKDKMIAIAAKNYHRVIIEIKETGEEIIYNNQHEIPNPTKKRRETISKCCRGLRETYCNSIWKYQ